MSAFLNARFLASADKLPDIPPETVPELAFAGRSNVGKSSAINALASRRRLAFSSKTPGRTRTINFFDLGNRGRLADLPGYGYASAPRAVRAGWGALVGGYISRRRSLAGVVLLMDARHPLTAGDRQFLDWLAPVATRRMVLLSKSDKLSRTAGAAALAAVRRALARFADPGAVLLFSSRSGEGVAAARALLERWLADARQGPK